MRINLITRAFNRLEYTVLAVRGLHAMAGTDYTHIVIDQASTDGTGEWLRSIEAEGYYPVRSVSPGENLGDAGGMRAGLALLDPDCEIVGQWDNDCRPLAPGLIERAAMLLAHNRKIGIVMFRRVGVGKTIFTRSKHHECGVDYGDIPRATCCMLFRRELAQAADIKIGGERIGWGFALSRYARAQGLRIVKAIDLAVEHIDTTSGQHTRYPLYFDAVSSGYTNYSAVDYARCAAEVRGGPESTVP